MPIAFKTLSKLSNGSPIPIKTMLDILIFASRSTARICSTISPEVKFLSNLIPVDAQNLHPILQPILAKDNNDNLEDAKGLVNLLKGMICHVNLIPINKIENGAYTKSTNENIIKFIIENLIVQKFFNKNFAHEQIYVKPKIK